MILACLIQDCFIEKEEESLEMKSSFNFPLYHELQQNTSLLIIINFYFYCFCCCR